MSSVELSTLTNHELGINFVTKEVKIPPAEPEA
jgi:hypothetical protein